MRAAVSTWTPASASAAVANHAFIAIVDEKTVVTRSVYRSATSAISTGSSLFDHLDSVLPAPVAQGIERAPPEREAAGSNPAGRMSNVSPPREHPRRRSVGGSRLRLRR